MLETMISLVVLTVVIAIVLTAMAGITTTQGTIANRVEMHSGVRSATELLQQEIGQAGRVSLPAAVTLTQAATASSNETLTVSSTSGMYPGMYLDVLPDTASSANYETIQLTAVSSATSITVSSFSFAHISGAQLTVSGAIGPGIIPPAALSYTAPACPSGTVAPTTYTAYNYGSTCNTLKMLGDINGTGTIGYIEYVCSPGTTTAPGYLYRNVITNPLTATSKPAVSSSMVLLGNLLSNPSGAPCFSYQTAVGASGTTYVLDVAVTLTVQTQQVDPQTHGFQQETKALLNVSPRNTFYAWELDSAQAHSLERIQPIPANITTNLLNP